MVCLQPTYIYVPRPRASELPRPPRGGDSPLQKVKDHIFCPPLDLIGTWGASRATEGQKVALLTSWVWLSKHGSLGMSLALSQDGATVNIKYLIQKQE